MALKISLVSTDEHDRLTGRERLDSVWHGVSPNVPTQLVGIDIEGAEPDSYIEQVEFGLGVTQLVASLSLHDFRKVQGQLSWSIVAPSRVIIVTLSKKAKTVELVVTPCRRMHSH